MFRRLYYNKETGNSIMVYSTSNPDFKKPSFGQDKKTFSHFEGMKESVIGWLDFENGEFHNDFMICESVRVNLETRKPEFTYREPGSAPPVFQDVPLSTRVSELEARVSKLEGQ